MILVLDDFDAGRVTDYVKKHIFEITDARYKAENNHFFHTHQSIMRPDVPSKDHKAIGPARP